MMEQGSVAREFVAKLRAYPRAANVPGLRERTAAQRFADELAASMLHYRRIQQGVFVGHTDVLQDGFNPIIEILRLQKTGESDEACWLSFLAVHFGWDWTPSDSTGKLVRLFYSKLGAGKWDWATVASSPESVRPWLECNLGVFTRLSFGNHRKHEHLAPAHRDGTPSVIASLVAWVRGNGHDSLYAALAKCVAGCAPDSAFDNVYRNFAVRRFGRLGKFDYLSLLGNLGVLPIHPGHTYVVGSTGPRKGALLLIGQKKGRLTRRVIEELEHLQRYLEVPAEVLEDALCNWQKRPRKKLSPALVVLR
jgi:Alpha-glutamyl/putrescinyl thymine pyrophosphorylase clade 3